MVCLVRNPFRVKRKYLLPIPRLSLRSNPGLRLANTFGVRVNTFDVNEENLDMTR